MGTIRPLAAEHEPRHFRSRYPETVRAATRRECPRSGSNSRRRRFRQRLKQWKTRRQWDRAANLLELHRLTTLIWRESRKNEKMQSLPYSTEKVTRRGVESTVASRSNHTRVTCPLKGLSGDSAVIVMPWDCYRCSSAGFDRISLCGAQTAGN